MRTFHGIVSIIHVVNYVLVNNFVSQLSVLKAAYTDWWHDPFLFDRPLPEEEELEDELFAGTSEEQDTGNETRIVCVVLL